MRKKTVVSLACPAVRAKVLGVNVYRGFAMLCDLADVSRADIYDAQSNPKGTQRDLSPGHARDAYEYVKNHDLGFWPEVFLCARKNVVVTFRPLSDPYQIWGCWKWTWRMSQGQDRHRHLSSRWQSPTALRRRRGGGL